MDAVYVRDVRGADVSQSVYVEAALAWCELAIKRAQRGDSPDARAYALAMWSYYCAKVSGASDESAEIERDAMFTRHLSALLQG